MSTQEMTDREVLHTIQVRDPNGHRSVFLEGVKASDTVHTIRGRALSELRLTPEVDWNVREDGRGRLLREDQLMADVLGDAETQITLTMQPDAGLG